MILDFFGHNKQNEVCTTTSINVSRIDLNTYGDKEIIDELNAFQNREVEYYQVNEDSIGFARNFGGKAQSLGLYIHNRLFKKSENPVEHLALDSEFNTGENYTRVLLQKGIRIAVGYIANGRGMQARISSLDKDKITEDS